MKNIKKIQKCVISTRLAISEILLIYSLLVPEEMWYLLYFLTTEYFQIKYMLNIPLLYMETEKKMEKIPQ